MHPSTTFGAASSCTLKLLLEHLTLTFGSERGGENDRGKKNIGRVASLFALSVSANREKMVYFYICHAMQLTMQVLSTSTYFIWSEWRLTVIAATVRIALVDILDLSEVDIPAGGFLYPAVGWG